ncbi:hypothetical protein AB0B74_12135 [Micromonospora parva]|uniref:hypothetical protein n=1 Tax=Micromonospora parva TaxID=1464048 RepID=UPI0033D0E2D9
MELQRTLEVLRRRPGMLGIDGSFGQTAAFLEGVNAGQQGGLLQGFREWLVVQVGDGANLTWRALVLRLANGESVGGGLEGLSADDERRITTVLFDQLDQFLAVRESTDGLLKIYDNYLKWLRRQDWYTPNSQSYLD